MTEATRWWWVRHGPVPDAEGRIIGHLDFGCDCSNTSVVNGLAALLPLQAVAVISPLLRTRQTLAAIAAAGGTSADPLVEADFIEQSFGEWEGLGWAQMQARDPDYYAHFWLDPTRNAPPGGESFSAQVERTAAAIERLSARFAGRDLVCVSHGGTIRAACAHALNLTTHVAMGIVVDNLSITRLDRVGAALLSGTGGLWRVHHINAPAHWTLQSTLC
jgi:broad specificity phosphatase PhoE